MLLSTLALAHLTITVLATDCPCGYTVNSTTSPEHALFTQILETDFLHTHSLTSGTWIPQAYNVTPANANGPFGKAAQVENVATNPIASDYDWGGPGDPGLQLWVRSSLIDNMIPMAEIVSARDDVLYGSFRIGMKTTRVNGTCGAFFFYLSDTEEIDLEFLSKTPQKVNLVIQSPASAASGYVQPGSPDFDAHHLSFSPGSGYHEYRFDWLPDRVDFYTDGILIKTIRENVPNAAGRIHVSHWSNGNAGWSGGPPEQDAVMTVSYVKGYINSSDEGRVEEAGRRCDDGAESCEIPSQTTPPDPGGENGNQTGKTFFFLGPENTTKSGGEAGQPGNGSSPTKGAAANSAPTAACALMMFVAAIMVLGA